MIERIPDTWENIKLGDICSIISGKTPNGINNIISSGGAPFYKISDMNFEGNEIFMNNAQLYFDDKQITKYRLQIHPKGTVIFPKRGGAILTNKKRILSQPSFFDLNIMGIFSSIIPSKFLYYWLISIDLGKLADGSNIPQINHKDIEPLLLPFPPLNEQHRIVAKIEELFTQLDAGIASLQAAQVRLGQYRKAVLKHAFEGKLTEAWRQAHQHEIEPASVLLERIREERKEILGNKILSKKNSDSEPVSIPGISIPETWIWVTPKIITDPNDPYALTIGPFGSNLKVSDYRNSGVPLVFVKNIRSGLFNYSDTKYVTYEKSGELRPHQIDGGDILITKMGEPPGDAIQYPRNHPKAIITADCLKFRLNPILEENKFFVYLINSPIIKNQIIQITKGVAQKKISLERFREIALPLPPLKEQIEIVKELERVVTNIDFQLSLIKDSYLKADSLRQSILKKAFEGRLVPQDPNDEPASVLLERIRQEKANAEPKRRGKKRNA